MSKSLRAPNPARLTFLRAAGSDGTIEGSLLDAHGEPLFLNEAHDDEHEFSLTVGATAKSFRQLIEDAGQFWPEGVVGAEFTVKTAAVIIGRGGSLDGSGTQGIRDNMVPTTKSRSYAVDTVVLAGSVADNRPV